MNDNQEFTRKKRTKGMAGAGREMLSHRPGPTAGVPSLSLCLPPIFDDVAGE